MSRQVTWMRKVSRGTLNASYLAGNDKPVVDFGEAFGYEQKVGEPVYDNGSYYVIDTVDELRYAVLDNNNCKISEVNLDKYEAIKLADDYKDADDRNGYNSGEYTDLH